MKTVIALASLLAFAPLAHAAQSLAVPGTEISAPAVITDDMVIATYALANVSDAAEELATSTSRLSGVSGTYAASYLLDLLADTKGLKHAAVRLALLLDEAAPAEEIDAELSTLELKFLAVNRGHSKVVTQLQSQGKAFEAYQLRTAYSKIRSRYVYLQTLLAD